MPPDKAFVEVLDIGSNSIKELSIKDVCVKKHLYTLPGTTDDRFNLERYYAEHVDEIYPEIYSMLTDSTKMNISGKERRKILNTLLSLYFRTPKLLHFINGISDSAIMSALDRLPPDQEHIKLNFDGREYSFHRSEIESIKKKEREFNRHGFLSSHLATWHDYVAFKLRCGIMVMTNVSDVDLVTSDNPVLIKGKTRPFQLFHPENFIQIPIDRKHYVIIAPNTEEVMLNRIFRANATDAMIISCNYQIGRNADRHVFGYAGTVTKNLAVQAKFAQDTPETRQWEKSVKESSEMMSHLYSLMEKTGPFSKETESEIKRILSSENFKNDRFLQHLLEEFEAIRRLYRNA